MSRESKFLLTTMLGASLGLCCAIFFNKPPQPYHGSPWYDKINMPYGAGVISFQEIDISSTTGVSMVDFGVIDIFIDDQACLIGMTKLRMVAPGIVELCSCKNEYYECVRVLTIDCYEVERQGQ